MQKFKTPVAVAALVIAGLGTIGCGNENGAGGTTDGTSADNYELRSEDNLAPAMDSVKEAAPDSTAAFDNDAGEEDGE